MATFKAAATPGSRLHREEADDRTIAGSDFKVPDVDMAFAASFRPSRVKGKHVMWLVTFVSGMGFTMFGYDQGVLSSLLTLPSFIETFPSTGTGFGYAQSLLVAVYQLGCMLGALLNLYVGDKLGRVKTLYVAAIGIILGTILQAGSVNYGMMIFARIFNGIFNGMLTSTVPTYQSECSRPERRGPDVMISATVNIFGLMCSYWVGLAFYYTEGQISWRFPVAFQCVFTFAMLAAMVAFRTPESPRWLASKGRHAESIAVLAALQNAPVDDPDVLRTWTGIVELNARSVGDFALKELFTHGPGQHFRRTTLGILAQAFQQLTGINLITYYLTSVLEDNMGLSGEMSRIIAGVNGTSYFLTASIAIFVIERLGRRNLLLSTCILMGGTMAVLAGLYELVYAGNKAAQVISVLCLFLFNSWFSVGWLGMTWLYPAEITPLRIRAPANGLATASNWLFNFFVVMVTGPMFATIRWGTYVFFAALNFVLILPVVYFFFPETKGRSLEELDIMFAVAYTEHKSPVKLSLTNETPAPGSREAEKAMGSVAMTERAAGPAISAV